MDGEGSSGKNGSAEEYVFVVSTACDNGREPSEDAEGVLVQPLPTCPHVGKLTPCVPQELPSFDSMCSSCQDGGENWVCLHCKDVLCSRYVNSHMRAHTESEPDHHLAFGLRDLSTWCFACESYIDALQAQELRPYLDAYHRMKFGTHLPEGSSSSLLQ